MSLCRPAIVSWHTSRHARSRRGALALSAMLGVSGSQLLVPRLLAQTGAARAHTAALVGRVQDIAGAPLSGSAITITGEKPVIADDSGEFRIVYHGTEIAPVVVIRLGYQPVSFSIQLPADSTVFIAIRMTPIANQLPAVLTTAERNEPLLATTGFFDRRRHEAFGSFLTPDAIARLPFQHPAQFLLEVPGMEIRKRPHDPGYDIRGPAACYVVFVDGTFTNLGLEDAVNVSQVYAIEVYTRATFVPARFQAPMREQVCGAIAVWTSKYRFR